MQPGFDFDAFNEKIFNRIRQSDPETKLDPFIYPFKDLYIKSYGMENQIRLLGIICLLILVVACINYMNLVTARSVRRAREVGMRKVSGAHRNQIIRQFYSESLLLSFLATLISMGLTLLLLPGFNTLAGEAIPYSMLFNVPTQLILLALVLFTGLLSGSYPALLLSNFKPVQVLKNSVDRGKGGIAFRRILVVFQFGISTILIIGTLVTLQQTRYLQNKSLGFSTDQLVYVPLQGSVQQHREPYKLALLEHPGILHATASSHNPIGVYWNGSGWEWEGKDPNLDPMVTYIFVDEDFARTFELEILEGEFYNRSTINSKSVGVINECFADFLQQDNPVGAKIWQNDRTLDVIAVVNNFHFKPVTQEIGPLIILPPQVERFMQYLFLKIDTSRMQEAIQHMKEVTEKLNPGFPFEYHFLNDDYAHMYRNIERMGKIYQIFAILAIMISALGLAGLAAYLAERRIKEIGIRRVLGSSVSSIITMMLKGQLQWVLLSNLLAWPLAWLYLKVWLNQYPYRVSLTPAPFLIATSIAVVLAVFSILFQAIRASTASPVNSLKHE